MAIWNRICDAWLTSQVERSELWIRSEKRKISNIHTGVAFLLCLSSIPLWGMKSRNHRKHWLKHSWNMLMPWFCFHWESSLAAAYHLIFACIESLRVNCHNMCFCLLAPQRAPLFEQSPWGTALDVYFGRNPIMHSSSFPLVRVAPLHVIINYLKIEHAHVWRPNTNLKVLTCF